MTLSPVLVLLLLLGCFTAHAHWFGTFQRAQKQELPKFDNALKKLSSNYLHMIRSYLSRKHHVSKRSVDDDTLVNELIARIPSLENEKRGFPRHELVDGYLRKVSTAYLRLIKSYLARQPKSASKRSTKDSALPWKFWEGRELSELEEKEMLAHAASNRFQEEMKKDSNEAALVQISEKKETKERSSPMLS